MATTSEYLRRIRVFIASPRDLNAERKLFRDAVERVNTIKAKSQGILLEAVGWEDTLPGKSRPQEKINKDIKTSHLIVMLLWKRWGSPTGKYSSGFEEEYEVASAYEKDIWFYFRDIPDDILEDPGEQVKKVLEFREKTENEKKFYFRRYKDEDAWKEQFIDDMCRWLDEAGNHSTTQQIEEVVKIKPTPILSGVGGGRGKVYDERQQPSIGSKFYRWDAKNFEEFWYDLENDLKSEALSLTSAISGRTILKNALWYVTTKQNKILKVIENNKASATDVDFNKFDNGRYNPIGWQSIPYVAVKGKAKKLAKLVIEHGNARSEKKSLTVGETWDVGDGWTVTAQSIDARATPRKVWLVLSKDGVKKDDRVINDGAAYAYIEKRFAGESDVPLFVTYVDRVFAGATSDMVQLRYTWAISTSVTEIKVGDKFGIMEVRTADDDNIVLANAEPIHLTEDSTVDIMGSLKFIVADDPNFLRFYPVVLRER